MSAGHIVTDEEVVALIPGIDAIGPKESIIVQGVEGEIEKYCQEYFGLREYVEEGLPVTLPSTAQMTTYPYPVVKGLRLFHAPVIELVGVSNVTARATDGTVTTAPISMGSVVLDRRAGWIFVDYLSIMFGPNGYGAVVTTYKAGYGISIPPKLNELPTPPDLKLAVLNEISRYWKMHEGEIMHTQSLNTELGSTSYLRQGLTPETKQALEPYRRILVY